MFQGAPRTLVWLVSAVLVGRLVLALLTPGSLAVPLLQVAFLAFIAWKVLSGSKGAAFFFGGLLVLGAAITVYQLVTTEDQMLAGAVRSFETLPLFNNSNRSYLI